MKKMLYMFTGVAGLLFIVSLTPSLVLGFSMEANDEDVEVESITVTTDEDGDDTDISGLYIEDNGDEGEPNEDNPDGSGSDLIFEAEVSGENGDVDMGNFLDLCKTTRVYNSYGEYVYVTDCTENVIPITNSGYEEDCVKKRTSDAVGNYVVEWECDWDSSDSTEGGVSLGV